MARYYKVYHYYVSIHVSKDVHLRKTVNKVETRCGEKEFIFFNFYISEILQAYIILYLQAYIKRF